MIISVGNLNVTMEEVVFSDNINIKTKLKSGIQPYLFYFDPLHKYKEYFKEYYFPNKNINLTYFVIKKLIDNSELLGYSTDYITNYRFLKGFCFAHEKILTENGNNILHLSCILDNKEQEYNEDLKYKVNKNGWTPFYTAIFKNNFNLALSIINIDSINSKDYFGNSAKFYCKNKDNYTKFFGK